MRTAHYRYHTLTEMTGLTCVVWPLLVLSDGSCRSTNGWLTTTF